MGYFNSNLGLGYISNFISHVRESFEANWPTKEELRQCSIEDLERYCEMIAGLKQWFNDFPENFQGDFGKQDLIYLDDFETTEEYLEKWEGLRKSLSGNDDIANSEKAAWYLWHFIDFAFIPLVDIASPLHLYKVLFPDEKVGNRDDIPDWATDSGQCIDDGLDVQGLEEIERWLDYIEYQKAIKELLGDFLKYYEQVKEWIPEYAAEMEAYEQGIIDKKKEELKGLLTPEDIGALVTEQLKTRLPSEGHAGKEGFKHDLTDTEDIILEALGKEILIGVKLLKKAGYDASSSHYRGILSNLVKRGILNKKPGGGYFKAS